MSSPLPDAATPDPPRRTWRRRLRRAALVVLGVALAAGLGWLAYDHLWLGRLDFQAAANDTHADVYDGDRLVRSLKLGGKHRLRLPPGEYRVRIRAGKVPEAEQRASELPVRVRSGEAAAFDANRAVVELVASAPVRVTMNLPADGEPLPSDFSVTGRFTLVLTPGDHTVWVTPADGPTVAYQLLAGVGMNASLDLDTRVPAVGEDLWRRWARVTPAGDLNGDGVPDLLAEPGGTHFGGRPAAVSATDGRVLWEFAAAGMPGTLRPAGIDLDGDGAADFLRPAPRDPQRGFPQPYLRAVTGRTGRAIWASSEVPLEDVAGRDDAGFEQFAVLPPLAPGGPPVVVGLYVEGKDEARGTKDPPRPAFRPRLTALDGSSGRVLWSAPFGDWQPVEVTPTSGGGHSWSRLNYSPIRPAAADLDGDGVKDVVLWGTNLRRGYGRDRRGEYTLEALSGKDGRPLWTWVKDDGWPSELPDPPDTGAWRHPAVQFADLGDGKPAVVVADDRGHKARVVALDGATGIPRWTWEGPAFREQDFLYGFRKAPPAVVRLKDGPGVVAVIAEPPPKDAKPRRPLDARFSLVLLDRTGKERGRRPLADPQRGNAAAVTFWVGDLTGDGTDAVLVADDGHLMALADGLTRELWRFPLPGKFGVVHEVRAHGPGRPADVIVRADRFVIGLYGTTGRPRWRCEGPTFTTGKLLRGGNEEGCDVVVLSGPDPNGLPVVVFGTTRDSKPQAVVARHPAGG